MSKPDSNGKITTFAIYELIKPIAPGLLEQVYENIAKEKAEKIAAENKKWK